MKKSLFKIDPISFFSHELKTPLSSLRLGMSLLEKNFYKNKNLIPLLQEELDYLSQMITDNLDLRVLQSKKDLFELKWQSFAPLVDRACSSLSLLAQKDNLSFDVIKPKLEHEVFMDSSWLFRVLYNLLSNSLNFSIPNSSIVVKFGLNKERGFYCSVTNTSYEPINSKKAFDLFYTKSFKQKIKGTGLGLSLAKAIVKAHKGKIKAYSKDKETIFCFTLPKVRSLKTAA